MFVVKCLYIFYIIWENIGFGVVVENESRKEWFVCDCFMLVLMLLILLSYFLILKIFYLLIDDFKFIYELVEDLFFLLDVLEKDCVCIEKLR